MSINNPRIRRLKLDYERLNNRFQGWSAVQINGVNGSPPEQYQITYTIKGIYAAPNGQISEREQHTVEINLSLGYPRRAPHCKILTPIFHPNFDEATICIGDFWAASEGLDELIIRIGRMIAYQEYNTKSPLNGLAARWADEHSQMLPVDSREVAPPLESQATEKSEEKVIVKFENEIFQDTSEISEPRLYIGGEIVVLSTEPTTIGRSDESHIHIMDSSISWNHAEITFVNNEFHLIDLQSTNGTSVNGMPISDVILTDGDRIRFGDIEAVYLSDNHSEG